MSKNIFINKETGEEFESVEHFISSTGDIIPLDKSAIVFSLRPIKKAEEKKIYVLQFGRGYDWPISQKLEFTEPQAEAVAEAIKALLDYLQSGKVESWSKNSYAADLDRACKNAHTLLQEEDV